MISFLLKMGVCKVLGKQNMKKRWQVLNKSDLPNIDSYDYSGQQV